MSMKDSELNALLEEYQEYIRQAEYELACEIGLDFAGEFLGEDIYSTGGLCNE